MTIGPSEYRKRQAAFAGQLAKAGLPGAVVVSRGGATYDRHAGVQYLCGHYQTYSFLPDDGVLFSGRAHCAAVVSATGRTILCTSVAEFDEHAVCADEVRHSEDFCKTVAGAMQSLGLDAGPVGILGADTLPLAYAQRIARHIPAAEWRDCDELLDRLRRIKSEAEKSVIRRATRLHVAAIEAAISAVVPGATEAQVVSAFGEVALAGGAALYFHALSSGPDIDRWTARAMPGFSLRRVQEGDLVRFDFGIVLDGYLSDFGRTVVAGEPNREQERLIRTVEYGIDAFLAAVRPGRPVSEAVAEAEGALAEMGVATGPGQGIGIHSSFPVHWGHGLGLGWERPYLAASETLNFEPGMYLAVERTLTAAGVGTAAAEQTLLIGSDGIEILSEGPTGRWS